MRLIGDISTQIRGITYKKSQVLSRSNEGYIPILRAGNINATRIIKDNFVYVPKNLIKSDRLLKYGDVLIAASSGSLNIVGKAAMLEEDMNASFGAFCKVLRPNFDLVNPRYFKFYFETTNYKNTIRHLAEGANINNLKTEHFNNLKIPLPPLAEQQKIAAILDAADQLRQKDQQLIDHYTTLSQSLFLDMFGDPVTNPMGWEHKKLGDICGVGSSKRVFTKDLVKQGIPFYRGTEVGKLGEGIKIKPTLFITQDHYDSLKTQADIPKKGDLLLPSICPDGRIFLVSDLKPFYFKDGRVLWIKVDKSNVESIYLRSFLKQVFYTNYTNIASGTTFAELKIFLLKKIEVLLPPIKLQNQFAQHIEKIEQQKQLAQASLKKSETLFNSLLQRAFKGELTHSGYEAPAS